MNDQPFSQVTLWCQAPDEDGILPAFPVDTARKQETAEDWTKLTRIGSPTHQEFLAQQAKNATPRIKLSALQPGHLYIGKQENHRSIYVGEVFIPRLIPDRDNDYGLSRAHIAYQPGITKARLFITFGLWRWNDQSTPGPEHLAEFLTTPAQKLERNYFTWEAPTTINLYEDLTGDEPWPVPPIEQAVFLARERASFGFDELLPREVNQESFWRFNQKETVTRYAYQESVVRFINATSCALTREQCEKNFVRFMDQYQKIAVLTKQK